MAISIKEIVAGRKVFFITPDTSLIPSSYLEDYFALGFECYFVEYDKRINLRTKIDVLLSVFNDVILFFSIDYNTDEFDWADFIKKIKDRYGDRVFIGVLFTKRQSKEEKLRIERKYLFDLGLSCGCVQLEYHKKQNFNIIERILIATQAQGRRKNIRALCTKSSTFSVFYNGTAYNGVLQDISLSHFSFVFPEGKLEVKSYEKLADFHFNIKGFMFRSDAVLIMERQTENGTLFIFAFTSSTGAMGLDQRIKELLIPNIYQLLNSNFNTLVSQIYHKIGTELDDISEIETIESDD